MHMPMNVSSSGSYIEANIFLGLIENELNSLLGAPHLVDYISVHIQFDLERYLLIIYQQLVVMLRGDMKFVYSITKGISEISLLESK